MFAELVERPVGNVFATVCAVFIVGVEGEALAGVCEEVEIGDVTGRDYAELHPSIAAYFDRGILCGCGWENSVLLIAALVEHMIEV